MWWYEKRVLKTKTSEDWNDKETRRKTKWHVMCDSWVFGGRESTKQGKDDKKRKQKLVINDLMIMIQASGNLMPTVNMSVEVSVDIQ